MQQRRGTASQWISTNGGDGPVLNAGEIGFESDTNKFKIGDGINHWVDLDYFTTDSAEAVTAEVEAAINALIGGAPGTLDTLNELAAALGDDPAFFTTIGTDLSDHTSATTNVHGIADTADLATQDYVTDAIANSTGDYPLLAGDGLEWDIDDEQFKVDATVARQGGLDLKAPIDSPAFTGTVTGVSKSMVGLGNVDNTSDNDKPISSAAQTALNLKAPLAGPVFTGTTTTDNLVVDGDLTVNGDNFSASATSIVIEDNMLQLAHENAANTVDLGLVVSYNYTGSAGMHAGIVRDVSENTWKLFKNVEAEPSTTVDFANGELDNLTLGALNAASATIGGVSDTEIQYLNGVTSAIQDQLDAKLASATAASTYAPIDSPTFTGTVAGITKSMVGLGNVDNSADLDKPVSTLTQTKLDEKAPIANPTFTGTVAGISKSMVGLGNVDNTADASKPISTATQTALDDKANVDGPTLTGTVTLPSSTSIGDVTSTEIGYLEGVTSAIQDQLDDRTPTAELTKSMVGLANVDNTADLDKPVSTDTQAALDLKADLNSPTFTGSVSGITKSMVGLGNVDNTADLDKPISDDTQTALDAKLASATAASTYAPIADPTFTGTVSGVTKAMVGLTNVDNTADADKPVSTATQTALDAKAPIAAPSFTGNANFESNVTIEGNLLVEGTTTTVNTSEVQIDDPIFYLSANQYDANTRDIGITGAYGTVGGDEEDHLHTGLVKDVTDGKWKLFSNAPHPVNNVVDFTSAAYDTLKVGPLEATTVTPSSGVVFSDGTQTKEGVPSRKTISQKTDSYTLSSLTERDSMIEISKSSAVTLTVPADATIDYPVGTSINILQTGAGQVTVAPVSGTVTVNATPGLKLRAQWSSATLVKRAANTWVLLGDLTA